MNAEYDLNRSIEECLDMLWRYEFSHMSDGMFEALELAVLIADGDPTRLAPLLQYIDEIVVEVIGDNT